jgi:hypothetical protein
LDESRDIFVRELDALVRTTRGDQIVAQKGSFPLALVASHQDGERVESARNRQNIIAVSASAEAIWDAKQCRHHKDLPCHRTLKESCGRWHVFVRSFLGSFEQIRHGRATLLSIGPRPANLQLSNSAERQTPQSFHHFDIQRIKKIGRICR